MFKQLVLLSLGFALTTVSITNAEETEDPTRQALADAWKQYSELSESGDSEASLPHAQRVYELAGKLFDETDKQLAAATLNLGENLIEVDRKDDAKEVLEIAIARYENLYGKNSPELIDPLLSMTVAHFSQWDYRENPVYRDRIYEILQNSIDRSSLEFADSVMDVAWNSIAYYPTDTIGEEMDAALAIYETEPHQDAIKAAQAHHLLANFHVNRGQYKSARQNLDTALGIYDALGNDFEADHDEVDQYSTDLRGFLKDRQPEIERLTAEYEAARAKPDGAGNLPIVRVAPYYPADALRKRKTGYVELVFTVDEQGFVIYPKVVKYTGSKSFKNAAIQATLKFRYAPRLIDDEPVAVQRVKTKITFDIR